MGFSAIDLLDPLDLAIALSEDSELGGRDNNFEALQEAVDLGERRIGTIHESDESEIDDELGGYDPDNDEDVYVDPSVGVIPDGSDEGVIGTDNPADPVGEDADEYLEAEMELLGGDFIGDDNLFSSVDDSM